jgi:hypothetical protein
MVAAEESAHGLDTDIQCRWSDDSIKTIAYASCSLNPAEQNHNQIEPCTNFRRKEVPQVCVYIYKREIPSVYTGCLRRNVPDFGRMFLMLKYTDITQNTYTQI